MDINNAIARVTGETIPDEEAPIRIWGASNDYNARGRGETEARRVLRHGKWQWFAAPASHGRLRAADRKDTTYGDVWIGELIAEYTLGGKNLEPDLFFVVSGDPESKFKNLTLVKHTKRRDGKYAITLPGVEAPLVVDDPAWR